MELQNVLSTWSLLKREFNPHTGDGVQVTQKPKQEETLVMQLPPSFALFLVIILLSSFRFSSSPSSFIYPLI